MNRQMTPELRQKFVEAGIKGSSRRWGAIPHTLSLTGLTEEQRVFVIETVAELRLAAKRPA